MEVLGLKSSYNTHGASAIYSYIGHLLTIKLGDYGGAIEEINVRGCLRSATRKPRPTLERLFDQFHQHLDSLPRITFRRKLKRLEIEFLSEHFTAEDDKGWTPSVEKCRLAAPEVAAALPLIRQRIKPTDEFNTERFLADAAEILAVTIDTMQEWEQIRQEAKAKHLAILATKSPWELLDIDWGKYHPEARDILDDPFFWECANDLAPNGNDTGADLLQDFRRWHKRHPRTSPLKFLDSLMKGWGIEPVDWLVTDEEHVRNLKHEQPIPLSVCNEAAIGLAFAVIKMRAECPPDVVRRGVAGLARTKIAVSDSSLNEKVKADWAVAIEKMRKKLESLQS